MKPSKHLLTLVTVAIIGLSSASLMADGDGDQLRDRLREHINIEITPELQEMIDAFRTEREVIMENWRAIRTAHRENMTELWEKLKMATASGDEDGIIETKEEIRKAHVEFRAAYGQDLRDARQEFRALRRAFRESIREQLPPVEDPEG